MTLHMDVRMNQRGITADLVDLTLRYGHWVGDRCKLNQKAIDRQLADLNHEKALLLRARAKGGVVVVEANGNNITTYPITKSRKGRH